MNDNQREQTEIAAQLRRDGLAERSHDAMLGIYKMGILHGACLLRGTDSLHVSDEQLDWCARLLEIEAESISFIPSWEMPEGWGDE